MVFTYPSLSSLRCPRCTSKDYRVTGERYIPLNKMIATYIGQVFPRRGSYDDFTIKPLDYTCRECSHVWQAEPKEAEPEELLTQEATIEFTPLSSVWVGDFFLYLNGEKKAFIKKKNKPILLTTHIRSNVLFATKASGVGVGDIYRFQAEPDTRIQVEFKSRFVR